ncbi:hypothetical protein TrVE_jg11893 [Triparma verrucosa]|uniref:Uncharacterized protein n=1 Tax=Triparma verrucosa TaxID=1606542 RepID=A0A9W7EZC4_9STRA|nr:hypothetical protein TrVE_jg11893 [Triparma verrucosa]
MEVHPTEVHPTEVHPMEVHPAEGHRRPSTTGRTIMATRTINNSTTANRSPTVAVQTCLFSCLRNRLLSITLSSRTSRPCLLSL